MVQLNLNYRYELLLVMSSLQAVAGTCVHRQLCHAPCAHLHQEIVLPSLNIEAFGFSRQRP